MKLRRLAERTHTNPGTLARSLLSTALDEADPDPRTIVDILDRIPGAWEDVQAGLAEAAGQGKPLEDLWALASVMVTPTAERNLVTLIETHALRSPPWRAFASPWNCYTTSR